jgi:hypothetical protein
LEEVVRNAWLNLIKAVTLAALSFASLCSVAQEPASIPGKTELRAFLRTAKEPIEHRRISAYYRQQAAKWNASSADHLRAADAYDGGEPYPAMPARHWAIRFNRPANHCRAYARGDAKKARKAESLAMLHEEIARAAEQRQP